MPSSTQSLTTDTTTDTTTTTTITSPPSTTPSEPSTTTTTTTPKPFRLLDLPFELVSQILEHSIEGVSSETEPIEISFSSLTPSTPIIEEEERGEEEKGEKKMREEGEKTTTTTRQEDVDIIEMKYPPHHHNTKKEPPHPGLFQTCRILRSEGPSPSPKTTPPPKPLNINLFLFFHLALHIHLAKSFFTFPCAGPGIRGIRLDEAAAAEKRGLVDEVYLKMREELLVGRNGMLSKVSCAVDLKKDVIW